MHRKHYSYIPSPKQQNIIYIETKTETYIEVMMKPTLRDGGNKIHRENHVYASCIAVYS